MSEEALHFAVRDQLRLPSPEGLGLRDIECEVMADGRPPPRCGDYFVSVHGAPSRRGLFHSGFTDEYIGVEVTVTRRINVPFDRLGTEVVDEAARGVNAKVNQIVALLERQRYAVMTLANETIGSTFNETDTPRGFIEPLYYQDSEKAKIVDASHFMSVEQRLSGVIVNIRFAGARRIQPEDIAS